VLRTQPAALRAWQHSRNGTLHGPTPWCTRAPARTLLSLCLRRRSIAVGVVLSGMGPRAEPLIQIVETANDVIMKLARALTLISHPAMPNSAPQLTPLPCAQRHFAVRHTAPSCLFAAQREAPRWNPRSRSPAPAAGHGGPARRAHRAGASAAPARQSRMSCTVAPARARVTQGCCSGRRV